MRQSIRIIFCLDNSGIGGTELNAVRTAERLIEAGYDVEVASFGQQPDLMIRYEHAGIKVHPLPIESLASAGAFRQGIRLWHLLRQRRVDVFHAQDIYGNMFGVPWARLARVPVVIASMRWWRTETRPGHGPANRIAFRLAHGIVANSPRVANKARDEVGSDPTISVVPNFVDGEAFVPPDPERRGQLGHELDVSSDRVIIGCIAGLRPVKDHKTLLEATSLLIEAGHEVDLVLVGDGELRAELGVLARKLELEKRVTFAGQMPHIPNLHHLFDISTLTSTDEALSNSLLEAMAAGNPVVATRVGGTPDAVLDGVTGLLVPPSDPASLAHALEQLLIEPGLMRQMGRLGRERVREHYSPERAIGALTDFYNELLCERGLEGRIPEDRRASD